MPDTRCLRSHPMSGMRAAFRTSLACCRRYPGALCSLRPPVRCVVLTRAQVEFFSVEPKVCDQGAELHDPVVQPTLVGARSRHLAHQVHMLATFGERVRAAGITRGWILATRARVGRYATCAYRLEAADERFSMVRMCMRVRDALARVCVRHCW